MPEFRHMQTPNAADAMNAPFRIHRIHRSQARALRPRGHAGRAHHPRRRFGDLEGRRSGRHHRPKRLREDDAAQSRRGLLPYSGKAELIQNGRGASALASRTCRSWRR